MDDHQQLILKKMKEQNKPLRSAELVELTGIEKKEIDKLIKTLKTENMIISPKRCFYSLPE